jgi:hypothetical protein
MSQDNQNPNPFATNPFANASPLAPTPIGDADFETFDVPPTPIGVLDGYVKDVKPNPKNDNVIILSIQCTDPQFASSEPITLFLDKKDAKGLKRIGQLASALGIAVRKTANTISLQGGTGALKGKAAKFVFATYIDKNTGDEVPTIAWGLPTPDKSPAWSEWQNQANLTDEQIKAIKLSPGAIPAGAF